MVKQVENYLSEYLVEVRLAGPQVLQSLLEYQTHPFFSMERDSLDEPLPRMQIFDQYLRSHPGSVLNLFLVQAFQILLDLDFDCLLVLVQNLSLQDKLSQNYNNKTSLDLRSLHKEKGESKRTPTRQQTPARMDSTTYHGAGCSSQSVCTSNSALR